MTTRLLDINVLLALVDPAHVHHEAAHRWFGTIESWATCPLTENGFIRILSSPQYPGLRLRTVEAVALLTELKRTKSHEFWPDEVSLTDPALFHLDAVSSNQLTDAYLLGLAVTKRGRLATLDTRIPVAAVVGGKGALEVI